MRRDKPTDRSKPLVPALLLGVALGLAGAFLGLSPAGMGLEEDLVLGWLFRLRGPLPPPDDIALVVIDRGSQRKLGLPGQYRLWPRELHRELMERLGAAGPRMVVFDIFFGERKGGDDALAQAFRRAERVLLVQRLEKDRTHPKGSGGPILELETLVDPSAPLADAAAAVAPFVLPGAPRQVSQIWTFKPETGDAPTLPAVALQLGALDLYPALLEILKGLRPGRFDDLPPSAERLPSSPGLVDTMRRLRGALIADPSLHAAAVAAAQSADGLSASDRAGLVALLDLYGSAHSRYLKYYGPPLTIEPLPFERVLAMDETEMGRFRGKAVFVGISTVLGSEYEDVFFTPYPGDDQAIAVSGVEIAATAYGNLLRNESIRSLDPAELLALLFAWGLSVGALARLLPARLAIPAILVLGVAYSILVQQAFARLDLWLPWLVPMGAQALPALVLGLWLGYRDEGQAKTRIAAALARYLPAHVADELAAGIYRAGIRGRVQRGVCVATDGERYTTLSERLLAEELQALLGDYYAVVFKPIRRNGGFVSDVVGDACLALWTGAGSGTMNAERLRACEAALDILAAVQAFNETRADGGIPIRIGLHFGDVYLGDVGAADHFEYRAVGDVVNTATRIEQLNKRLGTRLLISVEVQEGLAGLARRDLGLFRLAGKQNPVHLYELLGRDAACDPDTRAFVRDFEEALGALPRGEWTRARDGFAALERRRPGDGPSRFFAELCGGLTDRPPPQDGRFVVELDTK